MCVCGKLVALWRGEAEEQGGREQPRRDQHKQQASRHRAAPATGPPGSRRAPQTHPGLAAAACRTWGMVQMAELLQGMGWIATPPRTYERLTNVLVGRLL